MDPDRDDVVTPQGGLRLWNRALVLAAILAAGLGYGSTAWQRAERVRKEAGAREVARYFGPDLWDVVRRPERVTVRRLRLNRLWLPEASHPAIRAAEAGQPVIPSPDWVRRLQAVLQDRDHYGPMWHIIKQCEVQPEVMVEFERGTDRVEALFFFNFGEISIAPPRRGRWAVFDRGQPPVAGLMRELFPEDERIRSVPR